MKSVSNLQFGIRTLLLLTFSYSTFFKVQNLSSFQLNLLKTGLFNDTTLVLVAYGAVILELAICFALIKFPQKGILLALLSVLAFTAYITYLNVNQLYTECGCGGILNSLSYPNHLAFNLTLLGLCVAHILLPRMAKTSRNTQVSP